MNRRALPLLLVPLLLSTAFVGCLSATNQTGPAQVSRVHVLTLTKETIERADAEKEPSAALRELLRTQLVVRVESPGDYQVMYTNRLGVVMNESLLGLVPGQPRVIENADPVAPVTVYKGADIVAVRGGAPANWWQVGDLPLGLLMVPGAQATYALNARISQELSLTDYAVPDQDAVIEKVAFKLNIPVEGTLGYQMGADTGTGAPVELTSKYKLPADVELASVEVVATKDGKRGTAGFAASVKEAQISADARIFIKDNQLVAGQLQGGRVDLVPKATVWLDGFFADLGGNTSCSGKSRAEQCSPEEISPYRQSFEAQARDDISPSDTPRVTDEEDRKAIEILRLLFAQDIMPGDKASLVASASEKDVGEKNEFDVLIEFTIEAVGHETVQVPAGSFNAIKIVETLRQKTDVEPITVDGSDGKQQILKGFHMDETISRATFWLDAATYQPLKMTADTPVDVDQLLKRVANSLGDEVWSQMGGKPIRDDQWRVVAKSEASYEAVTLTPGARYSALVGLGLAHGMHSGGLMLPAVGIASTAYATSSRSVAYESTRPMASISLFSAGAITDNPGPAADEKTYTVASASPGLTWYRLGLTLDGVRLPYDVSPASTSYCVRSTSRICDPSLPGEVAAGHQLTIRAPDLSGKTLRVLDDTTNSVIVTLTVS